MRRGFSHQLYSQVEEGGGALACDVAISHALMVTKNLDRGSSPKSLGRPLEPVLACRGASPASWPLQDA